MGMFDSFYDSAGVEWQTKALDCTLTNYDIGDVIPGPSVDYQMDVCGGPDDNPFQEAYATIRGGVLASVPDERDNSLPLVDYHGSWKDAH